MIRTLRELLYQITPFSAMVDTDGGSQHAWWADAAQTGDGAYARFRGNHVLAYQHSYVQSNGKVMAGYPPSLSHSEFATRKAMVTHCECCGKKFTQPKAKHLDHDHDRATDNVRGVICMQCNLLIGFVEKLQREPDLVANIVRYLKAS
jgi:hypothetical protein